MKVLYYLGICEENPPVTCKFYLLGAKNTESFLMPHGNTPLFGLEIFATTKYGCVSLWYGESQPDVVYNRVTLEVNLY